MQNPSLNPGPLQKQPIGKQPQLAPIQNPGIKQAPKAGAIDQANEDDFWYQAPKGSTLRNDGGSNYQGYVGSQQAR